MGLAHLSLTAPTRSIQATLAQVVQQLQPGAGTVTAVSAAAPVAGRRGGGDEAESCLVLALETLLKPRLLLDRCMAIEAALGRDHRVVWGARPLDLDILCYDDIEIRSSRLHLPHPFAHSRPYVLEPLRQIAPEVAAWVLGVGTRPR